MDVKFIVLPKLGCPLTPEIVVVLPTKKVDTLQAWAGRVSLYRFLWSHNEI